jgi:hypothetical protein
MLRQPLCRRILVAFALCASSFLAFALEPFVVKDIRLDGLQRVDAGTVFSSLPFRVGDSYSDEKAAELSGGLKLQLHARRLVLPHPGGGMMVIEAPLSPEMKAGFDRFGFDPHEAEVEPFDRIPRRPHYR